MERIEHLVGKDAPHAYYETPHGKGWLPALPLPMFGWRYRLADAWAVLRGQATAVQWPHQRAKTGAK
jgi:hypothetical protein